MVRISCRSLMAGERGITPAVATLLLIALTVGAVGMVAVVVGRMQPTSRAPQVELGNIRAELIQANATNFVTRVSFIHQGGELLRPKELRVTINGVNNGGVESSTSIRGTSDTPIEFGDDTASVLANWQDFRTALGGPYYPSGTEVEIFVVHDPSGTVLANVTKKVTGPLYLVYDDSGIPLDTDIYTWGGGTFDGSYTEAPPEGNKCFRTTSTATYAGWGVFLVKPSAHTMNLSGYRELRFWVKTSENLKVEVQDTGPSGAKSTRYISQHGWDGTNTWQEIVIPRTAFTGVNFTKIYGPFMITVESANKTFYVDKVRWI